MEQSQQKYLVIGLAVVALVLAGVIGWLVLSAQQEEVASPATTPATAGATAQMPPTGQGTTSGQTQSSGQMPPTGQGTTSGQAAAPSAPANFDPKTATKVPEGTTPETFVKEYYDAVMKKDYTTAFKHLPADKQVGSSADALKQQIEGYGITGYKVTSAAEQGGQFVVNADQETASYGTFANTWVFVKNGKAWVVQSKAVTGMK